jgi:hypothetical protein
VSFSAPTDTGGSAITGYTATATDSTIPANGGQSASGGSSPITVTGLTNGDSYTFSVVATNSVGNSLASAASSAVKPSANPCVIYTGADAFVCSTYKHLLGRTPESGGLAYWGYLVTSGVSRGAVAGAILASNQYRSDLVTSYYETFLGRVPDSSGLAYWVAQLAAGARDESVIAAILGSGEFYTSSGGTSGGFVHALYEDLLGRAPESGGLSYWESQLSSGLSRGALAGAVLASTEHRSDLVNGYYETFLGRVPDSSGLAHWVAQLNAGAKDESVIAAIVGSSEFYTDATSL